MVEDVLKTKSSAGPDENNRLQVDVRFLDRERLGEVAGTAVTRCNFLKLGKLLRADTLSDRAARVETATGRRIQRRRRIASEDDALAGLLDIRIGHRHGRQQRLRVRMVRLAIERLPVRNLDHLTQIHNGNAIGDVLYDGQVVCDKQIRGTELVLQFLEQVQNLGLNGHIQSGYRLVTDDADRRRTRADSG